MYTVVTRTWSRLSRLALLGETIPAVAQIGRYLAVGGKRLRPMLTALGARAAGNVRP